MDYIIIPISLIYKYRDDLKDFGVQTSGTINHLLFKRLKQQSLMGVSGAKEVALRCYNNAYYVCTLILLEAKDSPELRISDYVDKILEIEKDKGHVDEVCLASMAMACLLLATYDSSKYGRDSDIWKAIYHRCTHYQWYHSPVTAIFHNMMSGDYENPLPLPRTEFAPRDIVKAIEEVSKPIGTSDFEAHLYANNKVYICERLACLDDKQRRMRGADIIIARLRYYRHMTYIHWGYDPTTNKKLKKGPDGPFADDPNFDMLYWEEVNLIEKTIDYFKENYPTEKKNDSKEETVESPRTPETEVLQATIRELESRLAHQEKQLMEANGINAKQKTRIKELEAEIQTYKEQNDSLQSELNDVRRENTDVVGKYEKRIEEQQKELQAYKEKNNGNNQFPQILLTNNSNFARVVQAMVSARYFKRANGEETNATEVGSMLLKIFGVTNSWKSVLQKAFSRDNPLKTYDDLRDAGQKYWDERFGITNEKKKKGEK